MAHRIVVTGISLCSSEVKCHLFRRTVLSNRPALCPTRNVMLEYAPRTAYFQQKPDEPAFTATIVLDAPLVAAPRCITVVRCLNSPLYLLLARISNKIENIETKKQRATSRNGATHPTFAVDSAPERKINCALYLDGQKCGDDFMCKDIFELDGPFALNIYNELYTVIRNSPWITFMQLPKQPITGMILSPIKFDTSFMVNDRSTFKWLRSSVKAADTKTNTYHIKDWDEVGDQYYYNVQAEDVGHYLKFSCTPKNYEQSGPNFSEIIPEPVINRDSEYFFENTHKLTHKLVDCDKFRVVDYNILANMYVGTKEGREMYNYCPEKIFNKTYKNSLIVKEVMGYNPDIVCLQEVEASAFKNILSPCLERFGLCGVFCPKSNDKEGTACFYNKDKFTLLTSSKYCLGEEVTCNPFLCDILDYLKSYEAILNKFVSLPHTLQLVALMSTVKKDQAILVGNVHLYASATADLIRLLQVIAAFSLFEAAKKELSRALDGSYLSFIICGDFNSTPDTAVHDLVLNGSVPQHHEVWNSYEDYKFDPMSYSLSVKMASACGEPQFTHYTDMFKGCLDYIYYQTDNLKVDRVYPLPTEDQLSAHVALPSINFPSDHIPLIADLQWMS